jgi:serine/threonine-protein kinase RsbW
MSNRSLPRSDFDSEKLLLRLNFSGPANLKSITLVTDWVVEAAKEMGCIVGKEFQVEMALREALANAIIHGCKNDPEKTVQFCVACDQARGMLIVVRDPGEGFDPSSIPSPTVGENVYSEHGRGIFLINQLMDEVHFERGGTEIHMRKR